MAFFLASVTGLKTVVTDIAAMPDSMQEEIKQKVIAALKEHGECTPENIDRAMSSKIYDLEDLIDWICRKLQVRCLFLSDTGSLTVKSFLI